MFNIFGNLWKRNKEEILPPPPKAVAAAFPEASGEQLIYKMKYDGDDLEENRQRNLIRFRISIKRFGKGYNEEVKIAKEEYRHWEKAKNPLFEKPPVDLPEKPHILTMNQRCRFLAYGYLRRKPYKMLENKPRWRNKFPDRPKPDWEQVTEHIFRYGNFNEFLLTPQEVMKAKEEQLDLLRKWVGN